MNPRFKKSHRPKQKQWAALLHDGTVLRFTGPEKAYQKYADLQALRRGSRVVSVAEDTRQTTV